MPNDRAASSDAGSYCLTHTALGVIAIGFSARGLTRVLLPQSDWSAPTKVALAEAGLVKLAPPDDNAARAAAAITRHLAGEPQRFSDVQLDTTGLSPFNAAVHSAARRIPPGQTRSYGELAALAGSAKAARAVGTAMATNRWPIVVPCHRVFASAGFGDYSAGSGVQTKLRLLWREGYRGRTSNTAFDEHAATAALGREPKLAPLLEQAGPFTLQASAPRARSGQPPFIVMADSIISQQLSGRAAQTIYTRVAALYGTSAIDDPAAVAGTHISKLRQAGLSENKALALHDLARFALAGKLPSRAELERLDDEAIIERLTPIRGVGRWSVQMLLMFYLGRPDVLPTADLGVQKGMALTYGLRRLPDAKTMQRIAQAWAPFRSVGSWYMWRAVDLHRYQEGTARASLGAS